MEKSNLQSKKSSVKFIFMAATVILAVIFSPYLFYPVRHEGIITEYSAIYGVRKSLVLAMIKTESGYDETCVSKKGAIGLMQLMPKTAEYIAFLLGEEPQDVSDTETNIEYGVFYISYLLEKFGNEKTALAAYNAGEGNVSDWLKDKKLSSNGRELYAIPYKETENYVKRVLFNEKIYRLLYHI